jgi:hypothetical protein
LKPYAETVFRKLELWYWKTRKRLAKPEPIQYIGHTGWPMEINSNEDPIQTIGILSLMRKIEANKMKPTNPNAHTYVNGTDVKTHGYAVTHNTFLQSFI